MTQLTVTGDTAMRTSATKLPVSRKTITVLQALFVLASVVIGMPVQAATITVTTTENAITRDGLCSLREAIDNANADSADSAATSEDDRDNDPTQGEVRSHADCVAGNGADIIVLEDDVYSFEPSDYPSGDGAGTQNNAGADNWWYGPNALPAIASDITIEGNGAELVITGDSGSPKRLRFFFIAANPLNPNTLGYHGPKDGAGNQPGGSLKLRALTLRGGRQHGGDSRFGGAGAGFGGAVYNQGVLEIESVTLDDNIAVGGDADVIGAGGAGGVGEDTVFGQPQAGGFGGPVPLTTIDSGENASGDNGGNGGGTKDGLGGDGADHIPPNTTTETFGGQPGNGSGGGGSGYPQPDPIGGGGGGAGFGGGLGGDGVIGSNGHRGGDGGDFGAGGQDGAIFGGGGGGGVGGGGGGRGNDRGGGGGGGFGGGAGLVGFYEAPAGIGGFGGGGAAGGNNGDATSQGGFGGGGSPSIRSAGAGAGMGGGVFNHGGIFRALNSSFNANQALGGMDPTCCEEQTGASGLGGALFNLNGQVEIIHSTFSANFAKAGAAPRTGNRGAGAAIYSLAYSAHAGITASLTLENSILFDNTGEHDLVVHQPGTLVPVADANSATASIALEGLNLIGSSQYTGVAVGGNGSEDATDPLLVALANNDGPSKTFALQPSSSAISAAVVTANTPVNDQRGSVRDAQPDVGAYESQPDFGDAPDSYFTTRSVDGARHSATGPTLGLTRDEDVDGKPSVNASGDDVDAQGDDEDGVALGNLVRGEDAKVVVIASSVGKLNAWVDWDQDGSWQDDEQVFDDEVLSPANNNLTLPVPPTAVPGMSFARFRFSTAGGDAVTGFAADGEVEDYAVSIEANLDLGDAPEKYAVLIEKDGARHVASGVSLGSERDTESDGQPSADATADGVDEDGISDLPVFLQGVKTDFTVQASGNGLLNAWFDFDQNGTWSPEEQVLTDEPVVGGSNTLSVSAPETALSGLSFARFRINGAGGLAPTGIAADGEVEDYRFQVLSNLDWGDAPAPYPTLAVDNGARHVATGPALGSSRDAEDDGQSSDDSNFEDGITFSILRAGSTGNVEVTSTGSALLNAWIDFNADGDWDDDGEQIFSDQPVSAKVNKLSGFVIPSDVSAFTYARFRLSTTGGLLPTGAAPDGEVEDVPVEINTSVPAVQISTAPGAEGVATAGDQNVVMLAADVKVPAYTESLVVTSLQLTASGSGDDKVDVIKVVVWEDNGDGSFNASQDKAIADGRYSSNNGALVLEGSITVAPNSTTRLFVTYDFNDDLTVLAMVGWPLLAGLPLLAGIGLVGVGVQRRRKVMLVILCASAIGSPMFLTGCPGDGDGESVVRLESGDSSGLNLNDLGVDVDDSVPGSGTSTFRVTPTAVTARFISGGTPPVTGLPISGPLVKVTEESETEEPEDE